MNRSIMLKVTALLVFTSSLGLLCVIYLLLPLCDAWGHPTCPPPPTATIPPVLPASTTPASGFINGHVIEILVGIAIDQIGPESALGREQQIALDIAKIVFKDYICSDQKQDSDKIKHSFCIRLVYAAANTDPDPQTAVINAVNAFHALNDENVDIIIGPTYSLQAEEAHNVAEKAGTLVIAVSNTADGIVEGKKYIFRVSAPVGVYEKYAIVELQNKVESVTLIYLAGDAFTESEKGGFDRHIGGSGLKLLQKIPYTYTPGITDFKPIVQQALTPKIPDLIVIYGRYSDSIALIQKLKAEGYSGKIIAGNGVNVNRIIEDCGQDCVGVYVAQAYTPIQQDNPINQEIITTYHDLGYTDVTSKTMPSQIMAQMFTAIQVIIETTDTIIKNSDKTTDDFRNALRDQLSSSEWFDTPLGKIRFDPEGEICQPKFYVAQIQHPDNKTGIFKVVGAPQNSQLNLTGRCYRDYPP